VRRDGIFSIKVEYIDKCWRDIMVIVAIALNLAKKAKDLVSGSRAYSNKES